MCTERGPLTWTEMGRLVCQFVKHNCAFSLHSCEEHFGVFIIEDHGRPECVCVFVCLCVCVFVCLCVCVCERERARERENNSLPSDSKALCLTVVGDNPFTGMLQDIKAQEKGDRRQKSSSSLNLGHTVCTL